ncbi:hypothetical protein MHYP_G00110300 [Metynnis hypsauchen]
MFVQANSVKDLKRQIGRSRIYILPNSHLSLYRQAAASLTQSREGRSSASSAAETRNSPVLPQLCQDENNGHIYVNVGTPEVFYRTAQPIQDVTITQNSRTDQASLSESTLEETLVHCPLTSSPIRGSLAAAGGVSHSQFTTISDTLLDSEPDEDPQMLSSPKHPHSPCDEMENLANIIRDFKRENISEHSTLTVVARRRRILHAITALNKGCFDWHRRPQIEFVGEMADDYDGPTREFFRLLMKDAALDKGKYYTGGKLIAWSLLHGGPGIKALHPSLYKLMCGQASDLEEFDISILPDKCVQDKLQQIKECKTEEAWKNLLQDSLGDWIADCAVPGVYEAKVHDVPQILSQVVKHFVFHRTANMVEQFKQGMNSCGKLWKTVERYWNAFQCLFTLRGTTDKSCLSLSFGVTKGRTTRKLKRTLFAWECLLNSMQAKRAMANRVMGTTLRMAHVELCPCSKCYSPCSDLFSPAVEAG